jgi:hypothetical protein
MTEGENFCVIGQKKKLNCLRVTTNNSTMEFNLMDQVNRVHLFSGQHLPFIDCMAT